MVQRNILNALRGRSRRGISAAELIEHVYLDRKKPFYPLLSIQAAIRKLNRRLGGRQIVLRDGRYRMLHIGGDHAGGTDHRNVHRCNTRRHADGRAAARETE